MKNKWNKIKIKRNLENIRKSKRWEYITETNDPAQRSTYLLIDWVYIIYKAIIVETHLYKSNRFTFSSTNTV